MDDAQTWFNEGVALYEKGDYKRAIAAFDKAISSDPAMAEVWNNRGLSYIQLGQYQEALRSIDKALELNPSYDHAQKARKIVIGLIGVPPVESTAASPAPGAVVSGRPRPKIVIAAAVVIVIAMVAAGGFMVMKNMQNPAGGSPSPVSTFVPTMAPTPVPVPVTAAVTTAAAVPATTQVSVPSSGVWIEVIYDQYYSGSVGTPNHQKTVAGSRQVQPNTGDQFYQVPLLNDNLVTASLQKNDGSGSPLTVKVYADGALIKTESTSVPYGVVDVVALIPAVVTTAGAGNSTEESAAPVSS